MQFNFEQQTVIVTGAAHGFGRAIALAFADLGARVWACDIVADEIAETQAAHTNITGRVVDVTDRGTVRAFVAEAVTATGRVDVLVNNAGGVLGQVG